MQPGYGIPEIQQFMVDSTFFTPPNELNPSSLQKHHHHHLQLQQQHHQQQQQSRSYSYQQQLHPFLEFQDLQQPRVHPQQQQQPPLPPPPPQPQPHLLLEAGQENLPSARLFPFVSNFRHMLDADEPGCSRGRQQHRHHHLVDEDLSLGEDGLDRRWPREEAVGVKSPMDSIRGPVWKLSGFGYNEENGQTLNTKRYRKGEENEPPESKNSCSAGYRLFNELELILSRELQAGSGSALTGDNNPPPPAGNPSSAAETAGAHVDLASETSPDEEGSLRKMQQLEEQQQRKKKRKRKQQQQLGSIAAFFEKLVNQLMEHQEALHRKFMEVMEKRDQERQRREEEWRRQEAARLTKERALRSEEEAAASSRDAAIISYLRKYNIGELASLPVPKGLDVTISQNDNSTQPETTSETNRESGENRRWPKSEVNALIKVRGRLEGKFREPGLKGPLWEEVSAGMAAMGYARSAKRCKEKWENINKYFRKTKDSTKRRSKQSKTCPYFHQLDLLYSNKAVAAAGASTHSELLDAMLPVGGGRKEEIGAGSGRSLMDNGHNNNEEEGNEEEDDGNEEEGEDQDDDEEEREKQQHDERTRGKRKRREGEEEGEE